MICNLEPYPDVVYDVPFTWGATVTGSKSAKIFRVGKVVYFSIHATGEFKSTDPIINITNAQDRPKDSFYNASLMENPMGTTIGAIIQFNSAGYVAQAMSDATDTKRIETTGAYLAKE